MVRVFTKENAEAEAKHQAYVYNYNHSFQVVPYGFGYAVVQTDCDEPHYLCNLGFFPINP